MVKPQTGVKWEEKKGGSPLFRTAWVRLLFSSNAFEFLAVDLLTHEAPSFPIALNVTAYARVI
jgi:hypothetical protein